MAYMENILDKGYVMGSCKKRFFSTSSETNSKVGGAAIYLPPCYDDILDVLHVENDTAPIPRFILLVLKIAGGPILLLCSVYACASGKVGIKAKCLRKIYNQLYRLSNRFCSSNILVAGDFNSSMNDLGGGSGEKIILSKIIQDFALADAFLIAPKKEDEDEKKRLLKQGIVAEWSDSGFTFFPKVVGHRPSRIDSILISASMDNFVTKRTFCLSTPLPGSDHKTCHMTIHWDLAGVPLGETRKPFCFRNHLLQNEFFLKRIETAIRDSLVEYYYHLLGTISKQKLNLLKVQELELVIFDRIMNDRLSISAIDVFYMIIERIEGEQRSFLGKRSKREHIKEDMIRERVKMLEAIRAPSRQQQKLRIAAQKDLADILKEKNLRAAIDLNLDTAALGEEGSRYFLRSRVMRRSNGMVRELMKKDGTIIYDSFSIEQEFFSHFQSILECRDPFDIDQFKRFSHPILSKIGRITEEDSSNFELPISPQELKLALEKLNSSSCGGPDGVSVQLLKLIHEYCPGLILYAINHELLEGRCKGKKIMDRKIIFIPKPQSTKKDIKRFRPISLLNILYRLADTCVGNRISSSLDRGNVLPSYVSAYRKGFSVVDSILTLRCFIENAQANDKKMVMIQYDISAAFDKCSKLLIVEILKLLKYPEKMTGWILKMPIGAQARLCINLAETRFPWISAANGCAQGQSTSAILYNLAMLLVHLRLCCADVATFKPELAASRKLTALECYTQQYWNAAGGEGQPDTACQQVCRIAWGKMTRGEKKVFLKQNKRLIHTNTSQIIHVAPIVSFSDDGFVFLEFNRVEDILNIMNIFAEFGAFSGLFPNRDKTRIVSVNFAFTEVEKNALVTEGFSGDMITGGSEAFTFLGNQILPDNMHLGAMQKMEEIKKGMEKTAKAFDDGTTLKGRRVVAETLMSSKFYSALTAFDLSEKDMSGAQKIIDSFVHRKKILGGGSKYLPYRKGGIKVPKVSEKHAVARAVLIKNLYTKYINKKPIPSWGIFLIDALKFIGYQSFSCLLQTIGNADLKFIHKNFKELGLHTLAGLFDNIEKMKVSINSDSANTKKGNRKANTGGAIPEGVTCLSARKDSLGRCTAEVGFVDRFGTFHNVPDPPCHRSHSVIGSPYNLDLQTRNTKSIYSIWLELNTGQMGIPRSELSARNDKLLGKWIANNSTSILSLVDKDNKIIYNERVAAIRGCTPQSIRAHLRMTSFAKQASLQLTQLCGPSSNKYRYNFLASWLTAGTLLSNSKGLLDQLLFSKYGHIPNPAIGKLAKAGLSGKIDNRRIGLGLSRIKMAINSIASERASLELALAAMRFSKDLRWAGVMERPCHICACFERPNADRADGFSGGRNGLIHQFLECAPAKFLGQFVQNLSIRATGASINLNLGLILLNEVCPKIIRDRGIKKDRLRCLYSILGAYRATLFNTYYARPQNISGNFLLNRFRLQIEQIKSIAAFRGSTILENIDLPRYSFFRHISYGVIYDRVIQETEDYRDQDRRHNLRLPPEERWNTEHRATRHKNQSQIQLSKQKESIILTNARNRVLPNQGSTVGINLADYLRLS